MGKSSSEAYRLTLEPSATFIISCCIAGDLARPGFPSSSTAQSASGASPEIKRDAGVGNQIGFPSTGIFRQISATRGFLLFQICWSMSSTN